MAKRENPNVVPKKFRKLKGSFLANLEAGNKTTFISFPKGSTFHGKEKNENVVLIVRSHWIMYIPYLFVALVTLLLPSLLSIVSGDFLSNWSFNISLYIVCISISVGILVYAYVKWFYNINIVTDQRVLDLDFTSIVSHSMSEARLERIEDVTHKNIGAIGSFFDIGTVYIQTAGATAEIEFNNIPKPREVQDIIYDLLESKQKGEI